MKRIVAFILFALLFTAITLSLFSCTSTDYKDPFDVAGTKTTTEKNEEVADPLPDVTEPASKDLIYSEYGLGYKVSVSLDFSGESLTIPAEYKGKKVVKIDNLPSLPNLKSLTVCFSDSKLKINSRFLSNLDCLESFTVMVGENTAVNLGSDAFEKCTSLKNLSFFGGKLECDKRSFRIQSGLENLTFENCHVLLKTNSMFTYLKDVGNLTFDGVTLELKNSIEFDSLTIDTLTVRNMSLYLTNIPIAELYLGEGANLSLYSKKPYAVGRLYLEDDFTFETGSIAATVRGKNVFSAPIVAPPASEIYIPKHIDYIPENFFGDKEYCEVYYDGFLDEFEKITVAENGNGAYFDGYIDVVCIDNQTFAVNFDSLGGSNVSPHYVKYGNKTTPPQPPQKDGYAFTAWYKDPECKTEWDFENSAIYSETTLYAGWLSLENFGDCDIVSSDVFEKRNENGNEYYYLAVDKNIFEIDVSKSFTLSSYATVSAKREEDSQVFSLSRLPLSDGENIFTLTVTSGNRESEKTYRAVIFRAYDCDVTLDYVTHKETVKVTVGKYMEAPSAKRDGYTLLGWYQGEKVWNFGSDTVTGKMTLTAKWKANSYTVTLDGNYGKFTVTIGESFSLPVPTRAGSVFVGWKKADDTVLTDKEGKSLTTWNIPADTVLYPTFATHLYRIKYEDTRGAENPNPAEYGADTALKLQKLGAVKGYEFDGWKKGETVVNSIPAGQKEDVTLTAVWKAIKYKITYKDVSGVSFTAPSSYTIEDQITLPALNRNGYSFLGWFDENDRRLTSIVKGSVGDLVLTAKWDGNTCKITYTEIGRAHV